MEYVAILLEQSSTAELHMLLDYGVVYGVSAGDMSVCFLKQTIRIAGHSIVMVVSFISVFFQSGEKGL